MEFFKRKWERKDTISSQTKREREQAKFYKNKQLLENLVPIQLPLLQKLEKLYNMRWERDTLRCPKFNNDVVAVKTKSLLDKTDVYSVSKVFISTEYERTHLPFLREFMQQIDSFSNDLKIFDNDEQQKMKKLMSHDRFNANFDLGGIIDEEINYL
jgi:hypothetical protein